MNSDKWDKVLVISRRTIDEWEENKNDKLEVVLTESLDNFENDPEFFDFKGYSSVFCCLGGHNPMDMK